MRITSIILLLLLLNACANQQQIDCASINLPDLHRCEEKNKGKGDVAILLACMPFSKPLKTSGTWVVGFEKNDFFEGPKPPPAEIMWTESTGAALIVDEKTVRPEINIQALQVDVVGRRAMCPIGILNPYPIVVQELRIKRRISAR